MVGALTAALASASLAQDGGTGERPSFLPGVRVSTTYSSNPLLQTGDRPDAGFIHEVSPYLQASSNSPRANYSLNYQLRNLWLAGADAPDTHKLRHALNARGSFALLGSDRFWVDLTGYMGTVNNSLTGPLAPDPGSSFVNVSSARHFSISPWFRDRIGSSAEYQLRYLAAHTGGNTGFALAKLDQRVSGAINSLASASPWNWGFNSMFQRRDFSNNVTRDRVDATATLGYRLNPALRVYGLIVYEHIEALRNDKGKDSGVGPGVGFEWRPSQRLTVSGSVSDPYYGMAGEGRIAYTAQNSTFGLHYSRGVYTSSDASLLAFDPNQLTSGQLGAVGINPALASLLGRGIVFPPGVNLTQSLITDAAMLDRRLTLFYGLTGNRNSLTLQAFMANRTSTTELSSALGIGELNGSNVTNFTGELHERGFLLTYQHRLDSRNSIDLTYNHRRLSSPTAGFSNRYATLRASVGTQLNADTLLFAGIRRTESEVSLSAARYNENAVYGGIDLRFR